MIFIGLRILKTVTSYFGEPGSFAYFVGRNIDAIEGYARNSPMFRGMEFGEPIELSREDVLRIGLEYYNQCMEWFAETGREAYFLGAKAAPS